MKIISVANQKGGIGKTTLTINLAYELSLMFKVLVIDMDAQCNLTKFFYEDYTDEPNNIYSIMEGITPIEESIFKVTSSLFFIPGSKLIHFYDNQDEGKLKRDLKRETLSDIDIVLIDNPPSINHTTLNSFTASDWILVPVEADEFSQSGLEQLIENVKDIRKYQNEGLEILGIVINKADGRRNLSRLFQRKLRSDYGDLVFNNVINNYSEIPKALHRGQPVGQAEPKSKSAAQIARLAHEVNKRMGVI